jgi:hypothetical protein
MPTYRVWITTHIERPLYVDAEDDRTAEWATSEYLSDSAMFWPSLPASWECADTEDYIFADESGLHADMTPGDIRAVIGEGGDIGYVSFEKATSRSRGSVTSGRNRQVEI